MSTNNQYPDLNAVANICQTLSTAQADFEKALAALELEGATPDSIEETIRAALLAGGPSPFTPLLDSAISLYSMIDVLFTNGYSPSNNTITVRLPLSLTVGAAALAERLTAVHKSLSEAVALLPAPVTAPDKGNLSAQAAEKPAELPPAPEAPPPPVVDDLPETLQPQGLN